MGDIGKGVANTLYPTKQIFKKNIWFGNRARICRPFKDTRNRFPAWQPYLSYRPARLHWLPESNPRTRFLGSINVYKYVLWSVTHLKDPNLANHGLRVDLTHVVAWVVTLHIPNSGPWFGLDSSFSENGFGLGSRQQFDFVNNVWTSVLLYSLVWFQCSKSVLVWVFQMTGFG